MMERVPARTRPLLMENSGSPIPQVLLLISLFSFGFGFGAWPDELNLLEQRLVESHATIIIPLDDRVIFVNLLNCAEFSGRLSEVARTLHAISGIQCRVDPS